MTLRRPGAHGAYSVRRAAATMVAVRNSTIAMRKKSWLAACLMAPHAPGLRVEGGPRGAGPMMNIQKT